MYDRPRSLALAQRVPLTKRSCFRNALLAFLSLEELHDGWYVEGFAVPDIKGLRLPLEHGWVALPDDTIIDVTYAVLEHADVVYFPALQLTAMQAMRLVETEAPLPRMLLKRSRRNRHAYTAAQEAAYHAAFGSAIAKEALSPR